MRYLLAMAAVMAMLFAFALSNYNARDLPSGLQEFTLVAPLEKVPIVVASLGINIDVRADLFSASMSAALIADLYDNTIPADDTYSLQQNKAIGDEAHLGYFKSTGGPFVNVLIA